MSRSKQADEPMVRDRAREVGGWRTGRPVEDPQKTKPFGLVQAKPSEFLVHVRGGRVRSRSSGQGASCFKWPCDSVAVIPTSLQQLSFRADQVTLERVGVEVSGVAVYRIANPLLAYRLLNFSFPERAQEKLEQTLTAMFVGAARRIVANLGTDECLQRRKAALADELMSEIAPVLAGAGRLDDDSQQGWGVVLDTIEIQEVRVLSETLFAQMQAPYRTALERRAREARAEADKEIAAREAACARAVEEAKIAQALVVAEKRRELAMIEARIAREQQEQKLKDAAELAAGKAALEQQERERALAAAAMLAAQKAALELEARRKETERCLAEEALKQQEAEARLKSHSVLVAAAQQEAELARLQLELDATRAAAELQRDEARARVMLFVKRGEAEVQGIVDESRARVKTAENLPALAAAVGQKIGEVRITQVGAEASPFAFVADAIGAVTQLVDQRTPRPASPATSGR
jgi:flotillin